MSNLPHPHIFCFLVATLFETHIEAAVNTEVQDCKCSGQWHLEASLALMLATRVLCFLPTCYGPHEKSGGDCFTVRITCH